MTVNRNAELGYRMNDAGDHFTEPLARVQVTRSTGEPDVPGALRSLRVSTPDRSARLD